MDKMRKYSIIWGIMLFLIVALLTTYGFIYKKKTSVYKDLEAKLVDAEKKYVDAQFLYPDKNETLKTTSEELISNGYLDELKIKDQECLGYVVVNFEDSVYQYKGYISCAKYKTKGYEN